MDQPGKVANPALIFPSPRSRLRIWSRETYSAVPSRVSLLILHTQDEYGGLLTRFLPISAAASTYLYRFTPSGQRRLYRVAHLRIDGVHCREIAGTGPVVLKVVPATGAAFAGNHGPTNVCLSSSTPTIGGHVEVSYRVLVRIAGVCKQYQ